MEGNRLPLALVGRWSKCWNDAASWLNSRLRTQLARSIRSYVSKDKYQQIIIHVANLLDSAIGNVLIATTVALNGAIGSIHHIPFSIASRAPMGFYFSYFAVVSRLILGLLYFG